MADRHRSHLQHLEFTLFESVHLVRLLKPFDQEVIVFQEGY